MNKNNFKQYLSTAVALTAFCLPLMTSCSDDYLDVVPVNDITTIESTFEKRVDAEQWLQTCYVFMTIYSAEELHNPAYLGADE